MGHLPLHYAVLHHPEYRECYAANLRRELPAFRLFAAHTLPLVIPNRLQPVRNLLFRPSAKGDGQTSITNHANANSRHPEAKQDVSFARILRSRGTCFATDLSNEEPALSLLKGAMQPARHRTSEAKIQPRRGGIH